MYLLAFLAILLVPKPATAINSDWGGEITYRYLGYDSLEITYNCFEDCNFSPPGSKFILVQPDCGSSFTIGIKSTGSIDITPFCKSSCSRCTNPSCGVSTGIIQRTYKGKIDLSTYRNCCSFTFSTYYPQRRSGSGTGDFYVESVLEKCKTGWHSSPVFRRPPLTITCRYNCTSIDHGAESIESDSLAHTLVNALEGHGDPIDYYPGYSGAKPIDWAANINDSYNPPLSCLGLHYDLASGLMEFKPSSWGDKTIACKVSQYARDSAGKWTKIGEITRDVVLYVADCPDSVTTPPYIKYYDINKSSIYHYACAGGNKININVIASGQIDSMDALPLTPMPGAVFKFSMGSPESKLNISWDPSYKLVRQQPFVFRVVAWSKDCPMPAKSYKTFYIYVNDSMPRLTLNKKDTGCATYFLYPGGDTAGLKFEWYINENKVSNQAAFNYHFPQNGNYAVRMRAIKSSACIRDIYSNVTVSNLANVDAGRDTTVCSGTSLQLHGKGGISYNWRPSADIADPKVAQPWVTVTKSQTFYLDVKDSNGCIATDSVRIKVNKYNPIKGRDTAICPGNWVTLEAVIPPKAIFNWSPGKTLKDSTRSKTDAFPVKTTTYTLTILDSLGCETKYDMIVYVNDLSSILGPDRSICKGDSTLLKASGAKSYLWATSPYFGKTDSMFWVKPKIRTRYIVQGTDTLGCSAFDTAFIYVSDLHPKIQGPARICKGDTAQLTVSGGGKSYTWSPKQWVDDFTSPTPNIFPDTTTWFHVTTCDSLCGCTRRDSFLVEVSHAPSLPFTEHKACRNSVQTIFPLVVNGYSATLRSDPENVLQKNGNSYLLTGLAPEVKIFTNLTETGTGCESESLTDVYHFESKPLMTLTGPDTVCQGDLETYSVNTVSGGKYQWIIGGGKIIGNANSNSVQVNWTDTANVAIKLAFESEAGCRDTLGLPIKVFSQSHSRFNIDKSCEGDSAIFIPAFKDAQKYAWSFGDGKTSKEKLPVHIYDQPGTYTVKLAVTSAAGCGTSFDSVITIHPKPEMQWQISMQSDSRTFNFRLPDSAGTTVQWNIPDEKIVMSGANRWYRFIRNGTFRITMLARTDKGCEAQRDTTVMVSVIPSRDTIWIGPNPFLDQINVWLEFSNNTTVSAVMYDAIGERIFNTGPRQYDPGTYLLEMPRDRIEALRPGMYFLEVWTGDKRQLFPVLKLKGH